MKSVIVLGTGPGWEKCPFDKEVWTVAKLIMSPDYKEQRTDRLFNMDDLNKMLSFDENSKWKSAYSRDDFVKAINDKNIPLVTSYVYPELKNCIAYPLKEIHEKWGLLYYTNTICYMIAMAIYEGYQSIDLWGVAQGGLKEYIEERKGVEAWLCLAAGMGIRVAVNGASTLFKNKDNELYGYKKTTLELIKEFDL